LENIVENVFSISEVFAKRVVHVSDYQRGYAWEITHCNDLLEDLELLPSDREHYTATIVLHKTPSSESIIDEEGNKLTSFDIVDGQQRLTSIIILLEIIRREMVQFPKLQTLTNYSI
jgi:uncharacterized protein with ParB-like and HNH nuclease domain